MGARLGGRPHHASRALGDERAWPRACVNDGVATGESMRELALVERVGDATVEPESQHGRSGLGTADDRDDIGPLLEMPLLDEPAPDEAVCTDDRDLQHAAPWTPRRGAPLSTSRRLSHGDSRSSLSPSSRAFRPLRARPRPAPRAARHRGRRSAFWSWSSKKSANVRPAGLLPRGSAARNPVPRLRRSHGGRPPRSRCRTSDPLKAARRRAPARSYSRLSRTSRCSRPAIRARAGSSSRSRPWRRRGTRARAGRRATRQVDHMRADVPEQLVPGLGREVRGRVRPAKGVPRATRAGRRSSERSCLSRQAEREKRRTMPAAQETTLSGQVGEALACGAVEDERLLTEDVLPVLEQRPHLLGVCDRRRGDDRELVRAVQHVLPAGCDRPAGNRRRPPLVRAEFGSEEPHCADPTARQQARECWSVVAARNCAAPDETSSRAASKAHACHDVLIAPPAIRCLAACERAGDHAGDPCRGGR